MPQSSKEGADSRRDKKGNVWRSQLCHPGGTEDNENGKMSNVVKDGSLYFGGRFIFALI